ncbi:hypothetical protein [Phaffia rhodozyma]|uniref:Uncharacterized protein n=1 Tax=Phaffia rhodozyma TaxID=264483 RepID=A0A0F7SIK0_PHARH|nr:hypothetical protein [Phaffia rhodozyma]
MALPEDLAFLSLCPIDSDSDEEGGGLFTQVVSSREERIQRAIEEGKRTYGRAQAETQYGWFASKDITAKKLNEPKHVQRYQESHAQFLYLRQHYRECLVICQLLLAIEGYDNRETIDIALRCTLQLQDRERGETLARNCRSMWITTPPLAMSSALIFLMCGLYAEALKALVSAMTVRNLQYPYVQTLTDCLERWSVSPSSSHIQREATSRLLLDVRALGPASKSAAQSFARPLFEPRQTYRTAASQSTNSCDQTPDPEVEPLNSSSAEGSRTILDNHVFLTPPEIDRIGKELDLGARTMGRLQALWVKIEALVGLANKGLDRADENRPRGSSHHDMVWVEV